MNRLTFDELIDELSEKRVSYIIGCERITGVFTMGVEYRDNGNTIAFVARDANGEIVILEEFTREKNSKINVTCFDEDEGAELEYGEIALEVVRHYNDRTYCYAIGIILA